MHISTLLWRCLEGLAQIGCLQVEYLCSLDCLTEWWPQNSWPSYMFIPGSWKATKKLSVLLKPRPEISIASLCRFLLVKQVTKASLDLRAREVEIPLSKERWLLCPGREGIDGSILETSYPTCCQLHFGFATLKTGHPKEFTLGPLTSLWFTF